VGSPLGRVKKVQVVVVQDLLQELQLGLVH
jgi:hypothetical protein